MIRMNRYLYGLLANVNPKGLKLNNDIGSCVFMTVYPTRSKYGFLDMWHNKERKIDLPKGANIEDNIYCGER